MRALQFLLLAVLSWFISGSEDDTNEEPIAKLIFYKSTPTDPVVENKEFGIFYEIINLGDGVARRIEVVDSYDPNSFDMIGENSNFTKGSLNLAYDFLEPNDRIKFNVTIKPKTKGVYDSTRARIRYTSCATDDDNDAFRKGYSSSLGRIKIISEQEGQRREMMQNFETIAYYIGIAAAFLVPVLFWFGFKSSSKTAPVDESKQSHGTAKHGAK